MQLEILSTVEIRSWSVLEKSKWVDYIFTILATKSGEDLFGLPSAAILVIVEGAVERRFVVKIHCEEIAVAFDCDPGVRADARIVVDADYFLVRMLVCVGYSIGESVYDAERLRVTGDHAIASRLLAILGVLPEQVENGLKSLATQEFPLNVDELEQISLEYLQHKRPFIIRRGAANWPASGWTLKYLLSQVDERTEAGRALRLVCSSAKSRSGIYLPFKLPESMWPDLLVPGAGNYEFRPGEAFLSTGGAFANLHRDFVDGLSAVFFGSRRFWLFPPKECANLYPFPGKYADSQLSHVSDPRTADLYRFPRIAEARGVEVVVDALDVLYVPAGWFHCVATEELSLIVKSSADLRVSWPKSVPSVHGLERG